MLIEITTFFFAIIFIGKILEFTIAPRSKGRYFLLHSIVNVIVTYLIWDDICTSLQFPTLIYKLPLKITSGYSCAIALHLYHCLFYKLNFTDVLHHFIMIGIATPYTIYFQPYIVSNLPLLMLNGIPGAIDYFLLYLIDVKIIKDFLIEKKINLFLNIWIREPISLLIVGMGISSLIINEKWICIPCLIFVGWNAIYFKNLTVKNTYIKYGDI
jgi:hypothetical protein